MIVIVCVAFFVVYKGSLDTASGALVKKVVKAKFQHILETSIRIFPYLGPLSNRLFLPPPLHAGPPERRALVRQLQEGLLGINHVHDLGNDVLHHEPGLPEQPAGLADLNRV